jgi:two-component system, OmpR family, response regulator
VRVLIVEDYAPLRSAMALAIAETGFAVDCAADGDEAWWYVKDMTYDAIILDLMLPGISGSEVLARLRQKADRTPVLIVTARDTVEERIAGLDAGADDYVVKPFAMAELLARLRSLIRRGHGQAQAKLTFADITLDSALRTVCRGKLPIELTPKEFALLEYFMHRPGHMINRDDIIGHVYGFDNEVTPNVVEVFISNLRRKLERNNSERLLHTKRGFGYVLSEQAP